MSSIPVDDTDPRFNYKDNAWTAGGQSGEFDSTSHSTSTAGAMVKFGPFNGTSIIVFSTVGTSQPRIHFLVDGGDQNVDLPARTGSAVQFQQQLYSATNLDPSTQHMLTVNLLDAGPFTLDYVLIGGQSNVALQQPSSLSSSTITSAHVVGISGTPTSTDPSTTTTATQGVGGNVPSPSKSPDSDVNASSTPSTTSAPSTLSLSFTLLPTGAGSSPSFSAESVALPLSSGASGTGSSTSPSSSAVTMGAASTSRPDAIVIGSVTGSIVLFALIVVSVILFLRRRRRSDHRGRSVPNNKLSSWHDPQPKHRPSLHLSIPSSLSLPRVFQRPSLLPTHSNKSTSASASAKHADPFGMQAAPSFLAEDPNDSPVFDIKQRPVSGSTMTTRVTVGTTIGQRISVPDSVYRYAYPESPPPVPAPVPPIPMLPSKSANPSPTETGASSATGSPLLGFGLPGTNQSGTFDTSIFSGYSEKSSTATRSGGSALRRLPYIPTDAKRAHDHAFRDRESNDYTPEIQSYSHSHRHLPPAPSEVETVVHQDGGVRLASNVHVQPRRELPPPYQDFGF